jgi:Tol biopolymer transport system component
VVFTRRDASEGYNLWQIDLSRNVAARLTFHPDHDFWPVAWAPDARHVVFASGRRVPGIFDLYRRSADGAADHELLYASNRMKFPNAFSPDGSTLLFGEDGGPGKSWDIWALPMSGDRKPFPVVQTPFVELGAVFSPDGRWMAYTSKDSATTQVVAQPYPQTGAVVRLSTTTGYSPEWLATGEVVYATADQHLMSVAVSTAGGTPHAAAPRELFARRYVGGNGNRFTVDHSGQRFLLPVARDEPVDRPIHVVVNWTALLPRK